MTRYVIRTRAISVQQKRAALRTIKTGAKTDDGKDEIAVEYEDLGWFVHLEGSWEALSLGPDKPDFEKGDRIRITIEKEA